APLAATTKDATGGRGRPQWTRSRGTAARRRSRLTPRLRRCPYRPAIPESADAMPARHAARDGACHHRVTVAVQVAVHRIEHLRWRFYGLKVGKRIQEGDVVARGDVGEATGERIGVDTGGPLVRGEKRGLQLARRVDDEKRNPGRMRLVRHSAQ